LRVLVLVSCLLLSGCIGQGQWGAQAHWPSGHEFASAAKKAATAPQTWAPLATAGLLLAADVDNKWSREMVEDQKVFGSDAESVSRDLRDTASAAYVLTALLAPSETFSDKAKGLAVGASTIVLDGVVATGMKKLIGRDRPSGTNDRSMPSSHASITSSRTQMAIYNINSMDLPDVWRQSATWALHGVAVGTGIARVEAEKHHLSDVLVGYALGQFIARFMHEAFMEGEQTSARISFAPVEGGGGAFTLTLPIE
jgi:PAP2 superfamily protein